MQSQRWHPTGSCLAQQRRKGLRTVARIRLRPSVHAEIETIELFGHLHIELYGRQSQQDEVVRLSSRVVIYLPLKRADLSLCRAIKVTELK